jgi:hypothetical protein
MRLRMRRLRLWGMGSRLLDELRFFAFGGGIWWGAWFVCLRGGCLSGCLGCWAFLDLFACEALFFCVPGALAFFLICLPAWRFFSVRLRCWPFLDLLVVY